MLHSILTVLSTLILMISAVGFVWFVEGPRLAVKLKFAGVFFFGFLLHALSTTVFT